jgi:hypothetical protein
VTNTNGISPSSLYRENEAIETVKLPLRLLLRLTSACSSSDHDGEAAILSVLSSSQDEFNEKLIAAYQKKKAKEHRK